MAEYALTKEQYEKALKEYARGKIRITLIWATIALVAFLPIECLEPMFGSFTLVRFLVGTAIVVLLYVIFLAIKIFSWRKWIQKGMANFNNRHSDGIATYSLLFIEPGKIIIRSSEGNSADIFLHQITEIKDKNGFTFILAEQFFAVPQTEETLPVLNLIKARKYPFKKTKK